ncbi:neuronal acetylcholine receptor subunit beta-3-like, partial [Oppia nitens]|uniref:neuronal acetylcholine receptor subunit beta-3-like n=1 Tax=Oppia nitens TaxID=1686743 RepID=UPI0023DCB8B5
MKLLIISIVLFSLSEICLSLQLYANENIDVTTDDIKRLRRQLFITQAYDKFARPIPKNDSYKVSVDYNLIHITNFDLRAQTLTTEGWLFMQWHDEGLVWQGQQEFKKIHNIRVPADQLYTPDMMAYNS